jgi:hypothetical protein
MVTCPGGCNRDFPGAVREKWGNAPNGQLVCDICRERLWQKKIKDHAAGLPISTVDR